MPPTRTQRWLDLLSYLLGRRVPVPVEQIMEELPAYAEKWVDGDATSRATARRTFERDKDDLRRLGVPLEPVPYTVGGGVDQYEGYRIAHRDFYLPYLRLISGDTGEIEAPPGRGPRPYLDVPSLDLSPSEAELALEALRRATTIPAFPFADEATSALRKLAFDLDPERFPGDPVRWVEPPGAREVLARLRVLSGALLGRKRVRFAYHGIYRGRVTQREVAPYGLFFQGDWYLVGRDDVADGIRVFRVSRMEEVIVNNKAPKSPDYAIPEDFSLRDYLDLRAWELGEEEAIETEVRFRFPLSVRVERNREGEKVREEEDGAVVRRFRVARPDPFLRWILSLAGEAEILSPAELREDLQEMARRVEALYADAEPEAATHA